MGQQQSFIYYSKLAMAPTQTLVVTAAVVFFAVFGGAQETPAEAAPTDAEEPMPKLPSGTVEGLNSLSPHDVKLAEEKNVTMILDPEYLVANPGKGGCCPLGGGDMLLSCCIQGNANYPCCPATGAAEDAFDCCKPGTGDFAIEVKPKAPDTADTNDASSSSTEP